MKKNNKTAFVGFRTKAEFKEYLEKTAKENDCTISDVLNWIVDKEMKGETRSADDATDF